MRRTTPASAELAVRRRASRLLLAGCGWWRSTGEPGRDAAALANARACQTLRCSHSLHTPKETCHGTHRRPRCRHSAACPPPTSCAKQLGKEHRVTVVNAVDYFQFVPSNPWVAVGWRKREDIDVPDPRRCSRTRASSSLPSRSRASTPKAMRLELKDGSSLDYDYLVITTGPKLAFDEVPGRRARRPHPVDLHRRSRRAGWRALPASSSTIPGPVDHRRDAGRVVLRPGLRVRLHLRHAICEAAQAPPQGADHLRDRGALHRPPGAGRRGRLERRMLESELRNHDIKWITNAKVTERRGRQDVRHRARRAGQVKKRARAALQVQHDAAGVQGRGRGGRRRGPVQPARLRADRRAPAQPEVPRTSSRPASASRSRRWRRRRWRPARRRPAT